MKQNQTKLIQQEAGGKPLARHCPSWQRLIEWRLVRMRHLGKPIYTEKKSSLIQIHLLISFRYFLTAACRTIF
jgi:hypothetical protein